MVASSGSIAMTVVIVLSIVVPVTVLGIVVWLFFRSARRFDAKTRRGRD